MIIVFYGPSCAGKSSIMKYLEENYNNFIRLKKYSSRSIRDVDDIYSMKEFDINLENHKTIIYTLFGEKYAYNIPTIIKNDSKVVLLLATQSKDAINKLKTLEQKILLVYVKWPNLIYGFKKLVNSNINIIVFLKRYFHGVRIYSIISILPDITICPFCETLEESTQKINYLINEKF